MNMENNDNEKLVESYWIRNIGNNQHYLVVNLKYKSTEIVYNSNGTFDVWDDLHQPGVYEQFKPESVLPDMGYFSVFQNRRKDQVYFLIVPSHILREPGETKDNLEKEFFNNVIMF